MQSITEYLYENLNEADDAKIKELEQRVAKAEKDAEEAKDDADDAKKEANKSAETINDEDDFRDYAENKFKEVFGDKLDKDRMNKVIDGLLKDNQDLVDDGEWGELIGMLNKSFGS